MKIQIWRQKLKMAFEDLERYLVVRNSLNSVNAA